MDKKIRTELLIKTINSIPQTEAACNKLDRDCFGDGQKEVVIEVARPGDSSTRYTITLINPGAPATKFAAFLVPLGKEKDWMFTSEEGRQILKESCRVDQLAVISMQPGHEHSDFIGVRDELEETMIKLAPEGALNPNGKVTFVTTPAEVKVDEKNVRVKGQTKFSGEYLVEDVIENAEHYRRLIFSKRGTLIQSEVKLKKGDASEATEEVDLNYISCDYFIFLNVGISLAMAECQKPKYEVLILGLGGGVLTTLIHKCFKNVEITAIEIDEAVYKLAKEHFCLKSDERMNVQIEDGLVYLEEAVKKGKKFDAIIYDVDNKDPTVGISCPPVAFLEPKVLDNVVCCLNEKGLFLLNLVCRSQKLKKDIFIRLHSIFAGMITLKTKEDVNEVVICWKKGLQITEKKVETAAQKFHACSKENGITLDDDLLDVHKLMETVKV